MSEIRILVTGANGFIGRVFGTVSMAPELVRIAAVRSEGSLSGTQYKDVHITGDIDRHTDWSKALDGVDVVLHLAARAHVIRESASDPLDQYRTVNTEGTRNLARQAADAGVKRLVYVSSIGVLGTETSGEPFTDDTEPCPREDYAISKLEAENLLREEGGYAGMETVIVRPPIVYGAGAPGNFQRLIDLVSLGVPLPLSTVRNRRSMITLRNLVDFLRLCCIHPKAGGHTFVVCDDKDWSTPELIDSISRSMGKPARMFPFPVSVLKLLASMSGQSKAVERLCGSLQIDSTRARTMLDWHPPQASDEGIREAVIASIAKKHR